MDKLEYLIEYLLKESGRNVEDYKHRDKQTLYRALVNIREPKPISDEYLKIEDEYLKEELKKSKITNVKSIKTIRDKYKKSKVANSDVICLWHGDITKLKIEAIVNESNNKGLGCFIPNHKCVDNQIHTFAGVKLRLACDEIMKPLNYNLETGNAIITKGYNLPAKYVIHTVGPVVEMQVNDENEEKLANCYINSLQLAIEKNLRTIAFPCISTGIFDFPNVAASRIAIKTVDEFISKNRDKFDKVVFDLWTTDDFEVYEQNVKKDSWFKRKDT